MSESDDTDELLLMPTQIDHQILEDNFVPYYKIVDKLITQVSKLKNRITHIEHPSELSPRSLSNSLDTLSNMHSSDSNNTCRRCYSFESLPWHTDYHRSTMPQCFSTQSTPQKPRSKLMLKSFPNSPNCHEDLKHFKRPLLKNGVQTNKIEDGDRLNGNATLGQPLVEENNIIKEIDDFLSHVKPSLKSNVVRNLDFDRYNGGCSEKQAVDVHQILKEMDEQEEKIKCMYDNKPNSSPIKNEELKGTVDWKKGLETLSMTSTDSSFTDRSTVLYQPIAKRPEATKVSDDKATLATGDNSKHLDTQTQKYDSIDELGPAISNMRKMIAENCSSSSNFTKKSISSPNFDINSSAKDVLSMHKELLQETNSPEFNANLDAIKKMARQNDPRLGRMNLFNLWGLENNEGDKHTDKCIQKLQEEKLRRTHCEELIQQLQNKILEQQEKLAVAIQVDEAKDTAIIKFHDAWEKATMQFRLVVKERDQLEKDLRNMMAQNRKLSEECEERVEFHRKETNQALAMAHDHQSKSDNLEKKLKELAAEVDNMKSCSQELEKRIKNEEDKNKQLSEIIANKEIELNESKNILLHAKKEVTQCQAAVEICQKDFTTIKTEYNLIQEELKAERQSMSQLHEKNKMLHDELENQRKNEKELIESLNELQDKMENTKKELRNFYQGQVELLVQTKLKEFQKQLDEAEQKMKKELEKKELEMAKAAALHIQQINDKYSLEINLLEQKNREEMQLQQVKTAQLEQRLHDLQSKYDRHQIKKKDLMKQLQKVMEAQWSEALRIINSGRSPAPQDESSSTIDQLQTLHSRSYQNMEALLTEDFGDKLKNHQLLNANDAGHHQKREIYSRKHAPPPRSKNTKTHDDNHLQRYINLLLHKPPENPVENRDTSTSPKFYSEHPTTDKQPVWQYTDTPKGTKSNYQGNDPSKEGVRKKTWK